jgi:hypothetical protein
MEQGPYSEADISTTTQDILYFIKPEISLPHSQEHVAYPFPEPDQSS